MKEKKINVSYLYTSGVWIFKILLIHFNALVECFRIAHYAIASFNFYFFSLFSFYPDVRLLVEVYGIQLGNNYSLFI